MRDKRLLVSLDIGTRSIKTALESSEGGLSLHCFEHGADPKGAVDAFQKEKNIRFDNLSGVVTGTYREILKDYPEIKPLDWTIPVIKHTRENFSNVRYIIDIGASSLTLLELKEGKFHRFQSNSLCASGTGSFLDQQMWRMNLSFADVEKMEVTERVPSIASRCAVFAKSDLIHKQQEGYSVAELWNGLVQGLALACYTTLFNGVTFIDENKVLIIGGLIRNRLFKHYFAQLLPQNSIVIPERPEVYTAQAALQYLKDNPKIESNQRSKSLKTKAYERRLNNRDSIFIKDKSRIDTVGNEIIVYKDFKNATLNVYLGVDIGSTSTKAALVDQESGDLIAGLYRKTAGNPISAYQMILSGIRTFREEHSLDLIIQGMGTTGSGRKLVGVYAGADLVLNEITAHLKGAMRDYPAVRTIFEIGGQDSKYILVENGGMKDANMNYVCAAGTGSFLEEQAKALHIGLDDYEILSSGVKAPKTNDRCTVFMEMDAQKLIVEGHPKSEVVTSILHAVCRNYLHRVVQNRPIEEPILFLGATARNRGLVEAFQNIIDKPILTSCYSHITGALGVTELLKQNDTGGKSRFRGWDLDLEAIAFQERICKDCNNHCRIIYFEQDGETVSWGYKCGKETSETERSRTKNAYRFFVDNKTKFGISSLQAKETPKQTIFIPRALSYYSHHKFWETFWEKLGFETISSPPSNQEISRYALDYSLNEYCYPLKIAIGHIVYLLKNRQTPIFIPHHIRDEKNSKATNSFLCPMTQAYPSLTINLLKYNGMETDKLISPVVDFSEKDEWNCDRLYTGFRNHGLNLSKKEIKEAFKLAKEKRERENERHEIFAEEIVKDLSNQAEPLLVIMGRSYNLYDEKLNLELIKDTAGYGLTILPFDLFPDGRERLSDCDKNMYWSYGQRFLTLAEKLKHYDNIHPIFLTNFNCGPDSFILSFLEDVWQDKPFLILELDEHNGNAGYLTRVEAFLDRIKEHKPKNATSPKAVRLREQKKSSIDKENGSLIFPPMHPYGTRLVAAAFTGYGYESVALTEENEETFQKGKSCLRGSECLPAATTLGSFLKHYEEKQLNNDDSTEKIPVMFMPSACGPCRFGQYGTLHSSVFERMNIKSSILSLSSEDNYSGFSSKMRLQIIKSIIATDIIEKIGTRIRPYSSDPQKIEELLESFISRLMQAFEKRKSISKTLGQIKDSLNSEIETSNSAFNESKPLVGIVGEIYVRSSIFSNDDLLRKIEANNAEAWLTPFMEWFHYTSWLKLNRKEKVVSSINDLVTDKLVSAIEKRYYSIFAKFLSERIEPSTEQIVSRAKPYLTPAVRGEAILTIGRSILFIEQGAKLIINVSPFSCMPGTIASTILRNISSLYSVPIVSLYYDGYSSFDDEIEHYLNNLNGIRK